MERTRKVVRLAAAEVAARTPVKVRGTVLGDDHPDAVQAKSDLVKIIRSS